jgi:hypothetical protein
MRVIRSATFGVTVADNRVCVHLSETENGRIEVQVLNNIGRPIFTFSAAQLAARFGEKRCLSETNFHFDKIRVLYY